MAPAPVGAKVQDFTCPACVQDFKLKSSQRAFRNVVTNGAYAALLERLGEPSSPHLCLLHYEVSGLSVRNFLVIPSFYLTKAMAVARRPLAPTARRAGWVGGNIRIGGVPEDARVYYLRDGQPTGKEEVLRSWGEAKGWLADTMHCIQLLGKEEFVLEDLYAFEDILRKKHPRNKNIRPKLRQQLQFLRDGGFVEFLGPGRYRVKGF
ncbi:MAG TPA: restriction endonuclease [Rhodospirillaceae bacterium]|nr:restriction endonuclease [Rhodospirillaceae bacterium]